ncbi:MAG TPA: sterol desaturase family protein [Flavisolibacter sp.]|nr:sterol desaturase family protein [Flavisolibacter sp.]
MPLKYTQILLLAVLFLLQYLVEHLRPQERKYNDWKNEKFNLGIGVLNVLLNFIPASLLVYLLEIIDQNAIGLLKQFTISLGLQIIITIALLDLWMYVWHRLNHTIPFLWRWHLFHHRDQKMNTTTAVRFHIVELLLSVPGKAVIFCVFGCSFLPVIIYEIGFFSSIVFHHSNIRIAHRTDRIYSILFASPIMHRIHHSKRREETHSNYGAVFSVWDRLFRSWKAEPNGTIVFGVDEYQ